MIESMSERWAIEADDLQVGYSERTILDGVAFQIPHGQVTCVVGASGCGKSTLLRTSVGLVRPRKGHVKLLGESIHDLAEDDRSALLSRIGLMFQDGALLNSLSVAENLAIPLKAHTRLSPRLIDEVVQMKLEMVHLGDSGHLLPGELSGGMRKRAGLARGLVLDPELILCDEPSAGLDPLTAADLDELILRLKRLLGVTLVVVTHEVPSILKIADRILMLRDRGVYFHGTLSEATASTDPVLASFFARVPTESHDQTRTLSQALSPQEAA